MHFKPGVCAHHRLRKQTGGSRGKVQQQVVPIWELRLGNHGSALGGKKLSKGAAVVLALSKAQFHGAIATGREGHHMYQESGAPADEEAVREMRGAWIQSTANRAGFHFCPCTHPPGCVNP